MNFFGFHHQRIGAGLGGKWLATVALVAAEPWGTSVDVFNSKKSSCRYESQHCTHLSILLDMVAAGMTQVQDCC